MAKRKKTRSSGRHQPESDSNWTEEIPHPASEGENVRDTNIPAVGVAPLLLTVAEVCALLNVSRMTVHRLEKSGTLPGKVKLGGQIRYHREIIEKWILEQVEK
jgi:excisionase family DNA binding protein